MILSSVYSNSNILNIPKELYKARDSKAAFNTSSLFFGSNFRKSYSNSINNFDSERVLGFAKFFASSLDSINASAKNFSKKTTTSNIDLNKNDTTYNNSYFEPNNKSHDIAPDLGIFINNINSFLDKTEDYKNNNVRVLNLQVKNDLSSNESDLLSFGISIDSNNRLKLDEKVLLENLDNRDELVKIATKADSIFNKLESRTKAALDDPISKYVPFVNNTKDNNNHLNMFNYLSNSQKFALNSTSFTGSIIDYTF